MTNELLPQGAELRAGGVRYRVWAPESERVEVEISRNHSLRRTLFLTRNAAGYHEGIDGEGAAGDLYKFRVDGSGPFPDPASRWQPEGVHGPSAVVDPSSFEWRHRGWSRPPFRDLVIYELHIGTFTAEGTFLAAIDRLRYLRELGVNAIEIMPVADFPGARNWGYDGVALYAPSRAYGHPDDLRALVDVAHGQGIAVILDVVYNHFGPDGNYLGAYTKLFFNHHHPTPWGDGFNFDGEHCGPVRSFFLSNALYWMDEFHIDGFRFDATHAIADNSPRHILEEIVGAVHARGGYAIAEDAGNDARLLISPSENGCGFDGVWADDFHHNIRVAGTGERESYLSDFTGTPEELVDTLQHGWHYRGQYSKSKRGKRGSECRHIAPRHFVHCISNHDQTGNRAFGERLNHLVDPELYRAASALLCLTPYTPMLFMGQEWAAGTPFQFFTDHNDELGKLVTEGRRKEFKEFAAFRDPEKRAAIPDPQSAQTFANSKLDWREIKGDAPVLQLYRACLALRRDHPAFRPQSRDTWQIEQLEIGVSALRLKDSASEWLILFDLKGDHNGSLASAWVARTPHGLGWKAILSTEEQRFGGSDARLLDAETSTVSFRAPGLVVLRMN